MLPSVVFSRTEFLLFTRFATPPSKGALVLPRRRSLRFQPNVKDRSLFSGQQLVVPLFHVGLSSLFSSESLIPPSILHQSGAHTMRFLCRMSTFFSRTISARVLSRSPLLLFFELFCRTSFPPRSRIAFLKTSFFP